MQSSKSEGRAPVERLTRSVDLAERGRKFAGVPVLRLDSATAGSSFSCCWSKATPTTCSIKRRRLGDLPPPQIASTAAGGAT